MNAFLRAATVSWKTTFIGILVFLEPLIQALIAAFDDMPETVPDWNMVVMAGTALIGFLVAKDADKTSEDHQGS